MEKCDLITSLCIDGFVFMAVKETNLPSTAKLLSYGFYYPTRESFNRDLQMWKEAQGCSLKKETIHPQKTTD